MSENIIIVLKTNLNNLSRVEKKIATVIIKSPEKFIKLSMEELAKNAEVSQGSIINFSKKYAGGGFPELKLKVSACISGLKEQQFNVVYENDTMKSALKKNIELHSNAYGITYEINNESTMKAVAEKILKAKKVEIYGVFCSAAVATDFCYQLLLCGVPAAFVSDILTCSVSASMLRKDSLVIAISSSGYTRDIIDAVKNAKKNNVPIVAITSNINSPLAKLSDYVLVAAASGNSLSGAAAEIRSSQLLLTDTICSYIRSKKEKSEKYAELKKILSSHNIDEVDYE